ncbi:D-alanyl-D-alanine carboxypeptidase/D-alanyl-D-alanine endopeptidase [Niallia sp. Krafla_26]|uniref:D-alanyl-D-alanine carboxypeptidase/D-alanyl-D-alanine endopeptidase n=1 Tax=Niallia sp. Krafla_26 TaxID=3064703 RepID=UPI003D183CA9
MPNVVNATPPLPNEQTVMKQSLPFAAKLDSILKSELLFGTSSSISIRNSETGEIIYSSSGDMQLHPASNLKLLTASTALEKLGADYQFSTEIWTNGKIKGNTLQGDLIVKGKGDPTLIKEDLDQFAKDLLAMGIHKVNGNLIADDSWYDQIRLSPDLVWSDETEAYGAQVSALTLSPDQDYDTGTIIIEVKPATKFGDPALLTLTPSTDFVNIINQTTTVKKDGTTGIDYEREHGTNQIKVTGTIAIGSQTKKTWISVWDPTLYSLHVFKHSLEENGIKLNLDLKFKIDDTPHHAVLLTHKKSMPLRELIVPFMKLSNNGIGETLTKEMGKVINGEGSWNKGISVIKETLPHFGVNANSVSLRDGSGISHKNLISANQLTQLLYNVQDKKWFPEFENSLPVSGMPEKLTGGTLRKRLTEEPYKGMVKAKTGTLDGVSTLSGYLTTKNGDIWIFAIIINNFMGKSEYAKSIEDEIVKTLVQDEGR